MLKQLEIEALKADLAAVSSLLVTITEDSDPIGHMQFSARQQELENRLRETQGRYDPRGCVGLFFNGRPVVGSRGIVAGFGAKAVEEFQNVVATRFASRGGALGRRGRLPQTDRAQMLITDAVRGSFGFVLEEHGAVLPEETNGAELKAVMSDVVDLLNKTTTEDEVEFVEARDEMDDRVLQSIQSFFRLLANEGATLRIVDNEREVLFNNEAVHRAKSRTDDTSIDDVVLEMTGKLYIMPVSRQFELSTAGGDFVRGKLTAESLRNITEENGDIGAGALGTWCVVSVMVKNVRKNDVVTHTSYRLVDVISVKNPRPEVSPS